MKKILCVAVLVLSTGSAFAQLYVRGNIGYSLPAGSQVIGTDYNQAYNGQAGVYESTSERVYGSFGSGLSFNLGVGASINGSLGYDVEVGYLVGKKYSAKQSYTDNFGTYVYDTKIYSSSFQIAPSLTFTGGSGNIQPYTRVGPVLAFTKLKREYFESDSYNDVEFTYEYELTGGMSIGFKGVVGVNFNADKKLQFFGELNFISMATAPKESKITAHTVNGENALSSIPKEDRTTKLKDKIDSDDQSNIDLREKYSMGSIGIQVGVKYVLK